MEKHARKKAMARRQYDFSKGLRGKYADRYARGTNIVVLDPDVRDLFPDSRTVNHALPPIARIIRSRCSR